MSRSGGEELFLIQVAEAELETPQSEHKFLDKRRFRFDFAWPDRLLAVEIEGGVWVGGRHNRGKGYENDCDKLNLSQLEGWLLLYVTTTHIARGDAAELIRKALKVRKLKPPFYNDGDVV